MARYKHTDNSQGRFMTVNLKEQIILGSFEWTINYFIDKTDIMKKSVCSVCSLKVQCINRKSGKGEFRTLFIAEQKYEENLSAKMRDKIDDPAYRELYSQRMQIIEPVFSNITYCKKMNRFTLRTKKKVNIQWQLFCIVHNLWKCIKPMVKSYAA